MRIRLGVEDALLLVRFDLPFVDRMGFADIDDEEGHLVAEAPIHLLQAPGLDAERRSSIAAEDERDRLAPTPTGEPQMRAAVEHRQVEIGRHITDARRARLASENELHQLVAP